MSQEHFLGYGIPLLKKNSNSNPIFERLKCLECGKKVKPFESSCDSLKIMCEECAFKKLIPGHLHTCKSCNKTFSLKIKEKGKCYYCISKDGSFIFPICNEHMYCIDCINDYLRKKIMCLKCNRYFACGKSSNKCYICSEEKSGEHYFCTSHHLCTNCLFTLKENLFHIKELRNCDECLTSIKNNLSNRYPYWKQALNSGYRKNIINSPINAKNYCRDCEKRGISSTDSERCFECPKKEQNQYCVECNKINEDYKNHELCSMCRSLKDFQSHCDYCYEKYAELYKTPRCTNHSYCEACLCGKKIVKMLSSCKNCLNYFDSLNTKKKGYLICNLCPSFNVKQFCSIHNYCNECLDFIKTNDYTKYPNISSCTDCIQNLKEIKLKVSRPLYNYFQNEEFPLSTEILSSHNKSDYAGPFIFDQSEEVKSDLDQAEPLPLYKQISPEFPNIPRNSINMNLSKFRISGELPRIDLTALYSDGFSPEASCYNCKITDSVSSFTCNHNICVECLLFTTCLTINNFIAQYKENNEVILQRFCYFCQFEGCNKEIRVPIMLIKHYLTSYLNGTFVPKNTKQFIEMTPIYYFVSEVLKNNLWGPYFDGIKSSIAYPPS